MLPDIHNGIKSVMISVKECINATVHTQTVEANLNLHTL